MNRTAVLFVAAAVIAVAVVASGVLDSATREPVNPTGVPADTGVDAVEPTDDGGRILKGDSVAGTGVGSSRATPAKSSTAPAAVMQPDATAARAPVELARAPAGRAPAAPPPIAPDAGGRPPSGPSGRKAPESAPTLPFDDPPTFSAQAFVPDDRSSRDVRSIVATVVRPDGKPAVGVTVRLVDVRPGEEKIGDRPIDEASVAGRKVFGRATTDAAGRVGFADVDLESVLAVVDRSPGLAHASARPRFRSRAGPASVFLRPVWRTVVRVTDPDGVPVPRATLELFDRPGPIVPAAPAARPPSPLAVALGDLRGEAVFLGISADGFVGRLVVTPQMPQPAVLRREVDRFVLADATIVLPRAFTIRGRIRAPRELMRWEIATWYRTVGGEWTAVEVPDERTFALRALPAGPVRFLCHSTDVRALDESSRETVVAAGEGDVVLDVDEGETLEIHVADLAPWPSGTDSRGQVWLKLHGTTVAAGVRPVTVRNLAANGVATLRGVRPGDRFDVYMPQVGERGCVYETDIAGAARKVLVHSKPMVELDGTVEGLDAAGASGVTARASADGWEFWPTLTASAIRGYVPPVASLRVSVEWRRTRGSAASKEGHAEIDPRRPFTIRVESVEGR